MEEARAGTTSRSLAERRLSWSGICNSVQYDGARAHPRRAIPRPIGASATNVGGGAVVVASRDLSPVPSLTPPRCSHRPRPGLKDAAAAQDLCRVVFATLRNYTDKPSCRAVERAVAVALASSPDFLKSFAGLLVKAGDKPSALPSLRRHVLTRWSCLVVEHLDVVEHAAAFAALAQTQGGLIAATTTTTKTKPNARGAGPRPCGAFQALLRRKPELIPAYLALLGTDPKSMATVAPLAACGLAGEILRAASASASVESASAARASAMDAYLRVVFAGDAKAKHPPELTAALWPLVHTLTHEEMSEEVLPRATRQLRRSPEATLAPTRRLLEMTTLDLSAHAPALVEPILAQVKHADAWRREEAVGCLAAIVDSSAKEEACRSIFDAARADVDDPKRRPKEWQARAGLYHLLRSLTRAKLTEKATAAMAEEACACLAGACGSESQRDARDVAAAALGEWLARLSGSLPKAVADVVAASTKDAKDGKHVPLFRALARSFAVNPGLAAGAASLVEPLAPFAKTGASKPSQRVEGAMALYVIARAAAADADAARRAEKEGVWKEALRPDGTYFSPASAAKLGAEDSETMASLAGALMGWHGDRLANAECATAAREMAALMLLHPTPAVRAAARGAMDAAAEAGDSPEALLASLRRWIVAAEEPGGWPGLSPEEGDAADLAFPRRLAGAALGAFCGLGGAGAGAGADADARAPANAVGFSRGSPGVPAGLAGSLALLAHHPLVSAPDGRRGGAWEALLAKLDAAAEREDADSPRLALRDEVGAMCDVVAGEFGARSTRAFDRDAAVGAAFAVARLDAETAVAALLPVAESLADVAEHAALTAKEIAVFKCRPGCLSTDAFEIFKRPEYVPSASRGKSRGGGGGSDSDDDAPAAVTLRPTLRASQMAAAGAKGRPAKSAPKELDKAELARIAQFKDEAETRARVRDVVDRTTLRLRLTASVMRGGTRRGAAARRVPAVAADVLPLLDSPVLPEGPGAEAAAALVVAAAGVPGNAAMALGFPGVPETFAAALRLSARCADGTPPPVETDARGDPVPISAARLAAEVITLAAALDAVAEAVEMNDEEPLPAAALALVFPVCARALTLPDAAPASVRKTAMEVLAPHAAPGTEGLPRAAAARLMLTVMASGSASQAAAAKPVLLDVAAGAADDQDPPAVTRALRAGLLSEFRAVRAAALAAILAAPPVLDDDGGAGAATLFVARHDPDDANRAAADAAWIAHGLDASDVADVVPPVAILPYLSHGAASVRDAAVGAFAASVAALGGGAGVAPVLAKLFAAFSAASPKKPDETDGDDPFASNRRPQFPGEEATRDVGDPAGRAAIVRALGAAAASLTARDLPLVSTFLTKVLADEDETVRDAAMGGGQAIIELHGAEHVKQLLGVYEGYLERNAGSGLSDAQSDNVRRGIAVFLGALACHLEKSDPKIRQILARLVDVLSTPSEAVQRSVANCLPPLMPALDEEERRALVESLLAQVTGGEGYADRRGAAFGLAGAVKGMGIGSLKLFGVMDAVKAAVEDKSNPEAREGALMAFELLNVRLGRLFEPYVIHVLPMLLACFGDQSVHVREATVSAARAVMAQLSAQGVKLVLPAIMQGLEDKAWRTKQGSVQLLGAMSACAPKQLGACLPQIVPRLSETLIDTHPKVVEAATLALKAIGEVIRNPEIQALSNHLLGAIARPAELTSPCLDILLEVTFVNVVDAPSLALIVPVLSRGLRDRRADLKKKAAKIAGNMCSLVADPKDMSPYVPILLPDIQKSLVDPSPEVRAVAAAALASLLRGMGGEDEHFAELVPWLTETLQSDGPMTERSGAAQGLAECLAVLGAETFEEMLPEILAGCSNPAPHVREGHLTLLRFLPLALGQIFEAHLKEALAEVLSGLADAVEPVRDAALGAGRVFVEEFSHSGPSLDLLLPSIEDGIASENWRIRQSAAELLGSMMFRIAGTSGKVRVEGGSDDEGISTEAQGRALTAALGEARHHDLLGAVYALRSDATLVVRQAAIHIWKTVVANTPRTLRLILPRLMQRLIAGLSAENDDRRQTASRCLGELVRKLGERVLPEVFPILRDGLAADAAATREGVCLGLAEVLGAARREQLEDYLAEVVPVIRDALCDDEDSVRNAAGSAFDAMFRHGGADVASDIVPALLAKLDTDPVALEGLKQVLRAQPKILASVLPKLASPPIDASRASTLGALAEVAGPALPPHLEVLFPPLLVAMGSEDPEESEAAVGAAGAVLRAVPDEAHYLLLPEIVGGLTDESPATRAAAAKLCGMFATEAPCYDEEDDVPQLIAGLFDLFVDTEESVVLAAWTALGVVMGGVAKEDQSHYLRDVRSAVENAREKMRRRDRSLSPRDIQIPGLCLPKGLAPIVQVYLQGVLSGRHADERESAAEGLREAVLSTTTAAIKPHVIPITGPLIRILGDKYPGAVKSAILGALAVMIEKGGLALKPFVPQLQTTFVKCLADPARPVRQRAAAALGRLVTLQPRVDPLAADLLTTLDGATDKGVREAMLRAIAGVFAHAGKGVQPATVTRARVEISDALASTPDDGVRAAAALALAHVAAWLTEDERVQLIDQLGEHDDGADAETREGRAAALSAFARVSPELALAAHAGPALNGLVRAARGDGAAGRSAAALGMARLAVASALQSGAGCPYLPKLLPVMSKLLRDDDSGTREAAAAGLARLTREHPEATAPHLGAFVPALADVACGDKSKDARYYADRAIRAALMIVDEPAGLDMAQAVLRAGGAAHAARGRLTDVVLRRLKGLPEEEEGVAGGWGSLAADQEDDDEVVLGD